MAYLIPSNVYCENLSSMSRQFQYTFQRIFDLDQKCLSASEENEFWLDMLYEAIKERQVDNDNSNTEHYIFTKVNWHLKNNSINFFAAFRYFWNILDYYKNNSPYKINEIKNISVCLERNHFCVCTELIEIPSFLTKTPLILVPNLVCFLYNIFKNKESFSDYKDISRNKFQIIRGCHYPELKDLKKIKINKTNKTLLSEYLDNDKKSEIINNNTIISIIQNLNQKDKNKVMDFAKKLSYK